MTPLPTLFTAVLLWLFNHVTSDCVFPIHLKGYNKWQYKISVSSSTRTKVIFTENEMMFIEQMLPSEYELSRKTYHCEEVVDVGKFIFKEGGTETYKCMEVIERSKAVLQLKESNSSILKTSRLCDRQNMSLNPWLLVSYYMIRDEFSPCPLNAGFNLKITDSRGEPSGCNFMFLPMRFESDCIAGEGMNFNFRKPVCVDFKDPFFKLDIFQKTTCVTHWTHGKYMFAVVRKVESGIIWCLRFPRKYKGVSNLQVELFVDVICPYESMSDQNYKFYTLYLEKQRQTEVCGDEYPQCSSQPCVSSIKDQCHKSCRKCDPNDPLPICSFPRDFRGEWILQKSKGTGTELVNVSASNVRISTVGKFKCVLFEDSPQKESGMFTTVSTFHNGCRPRYTCLKMKRLGDSLLGFAISQSFIWPINVHNPGQSICSTSKFVPDPNPVSETYRSQNLKPVFPLSKNLVPIPCNLEATYNFQVQINGKGSCNGRMYEDCTNSSLLRIDFNQCRSHPHHLEFICASSMEGRYWERLILLQNRHDTFHSICLAFSTLKPLDVIMLPSSQCDINSWSYVDFGLRTPIMSFLVSKEHTKCSNIPVPTTLPTTTVPILPKAHKASEKYKISPSLMRDGKGSNDYNTYSQESVEQERTTSNQFYENGGGVRKEDTRMGDIRINNAQDSYMYYSQGKMFSTIIFQFAVAFSIMDIAL